MKLRLPLTLAAVACLAATVPAAGAPKSRSDRPPRKVLVATVVGGYAINEYPLERRFARMEEILAEAAAQARARHPGKGLDLVVLPEYFFERPGTTAREHALGLGEVLPRIGACSQRYRTYLVAPMILREESGAISNAALLVGRDGRLAGIYRKVHPVAAQGSTVLEGGIVPGRAFPVFACDFGRLGIQICFDMLYTDGWDSLARQGAELIALPTASPQSTRPCAFALEHRYFIVSAAPRDHAAVYGPLGLIEAEATREGEVLVHEIDLSFAVIHWEAALDEGRALTRLYGDRVGCHYVSAQDEGLFWSNDPSVTIGQMMARLGIVDSDANAERVRKIEDEARGGPPDAR